MKISVALCTYNGSKYIAEQLNSILAQTVPVDEIVISDDGSSDDTLAIAERILREASISYHIHQNKPAKGVSMNFLGCMKQTTGDYCFTCDQDDIWCPDKVECFMEQVKETQLDLYFSDGLLVDGEGISKNCKLWESLNIQYSRLSSQPIIHTLFKTPVVTGAAMLVSRRLIDRIEEIPREILHDEWFSIVAALAGSIQPIDRVTFHYRQHANNVVGAQKRSIGSRFKTWLKGLHTLDEIRAKKHYRIAQIAAASVNTPYEALTKEAEAYWNTMCILSSLRRWKQLKLIMHHLLKKSYHRYYTGYRGFVRDIMALFMKRRDKQE